MEREGQESTSRQSERQILPSTKIKDKYNQTRS